MGILLGSSANLIFRNQWRLQIASSFIPAVTLIFLTAVCSESPRWLVKKGRYKDAFVVLATLRKTKLQAARDLYYMHAQLRVETLLFSSDPDTESRLDGETNDCIYRGGMRNSSYPKRILQLFTITRNRRATLAACVVMASQ